MINTDKYLGQEYKFNGREGPYDCLGLVIDVLADNGIYLPDNDGRIIKSNWMSKDKNRLPVGLSEYCTRIKPGEEQPLDVAVFVIATIPRHAGVLIDDYRFIHIYENSTVHISRFSKWKKRLHSIWRVR